MKVLILVVIPLLVGMAIGWVMGKAQTRRVDLSRTDRKELSRLRYLRDQLTITAAEHSAMGEPGAVIILDQIQQSRGNGENR